MSTEVFDLSDENGSDGSDDTVPVPVPVNVSSSEKRTKTDPQSFAAIKRTKTDQFKDRQSFTAIKQTKTPSVYKQVNQPMLKASSSSGANDALSSVAENMLYKIPSHAKARGFSNISVKKNKNLLATA